MYLFYVDESGNTGDDLDTPDQPIHWLVALALTPSNIRNIESDLFSLCMRTLGHWTPGLEFHGSAIFHGRDAFRRLTVAQRVGLYGDILALVGRYDGKIFIRGINKRLHAERAASRGYTPEHPHKLGFMYLLERLDEWLEAKQPTGDLFAEKQPVFGLVVADEQKEVDHDFQEVQILAAWRNRPRVPEQDDPLPLRHGSLRALAF